MCPSLELKMIFDFLWEMNNGDMGSFLVENALSLYDAEQIVKKDNPEVLDCLIEVNEYGN
jgi:hypothetical protein